MQVLSLCNQINIAICSFFWEPEERKRRSAYAQQNKDEKGKKSEKKKKENLRLYFPVSSKESNCTGVNKPFHSKTF